MAYWETSVFEHTFPEQCTCEQCNDIKEIRKIEQQNLIILDDFGLQPLDIQSRLILLEILDDRHGRLSTIITSQLPVSNWHEIIEDSTIADAILDRIVYSSHRIELSGESLRKKELKNK